VLLTILALKMKNGDELRSFILRTLSLQTGAGGFGGRNLATRAPPPYQKCIHMDKDSAGTKSVGRQVLVLILRREWFQVFAPASGQIIMLRGVLKELPQWNCYC
jgi:hypothetical protein